MKLDMKKLTGHCIRSFWLGLLFVVLWLVVMVTLIAVAEIGVSDGPETVWRRLCYEAGPFVAVLMATMVMLWRFDKRTGWPQLASKLHWRRDVEIGFSIGTVWLLATVGAAILFSGLQFERMSAVPLLAFWVIAASINVAMQEYLVRGYIFKMLTRRHSVAIATIATTVLFVAMHGFQGGLIGIANVVVASLIFTTLLVRTGTMVTPIIAHIAWNIIGGILLGVISLGGVYPQLLRAVSNGPDILTGGNMGLEGSGLTLAVSCVTLTIIWIFLPRKQR